MEADTRLLEEWKANNDLLKFHEDLRQKHLAHFLTIQTAFLAFFGLLARDALASVSMLSLTALFLIAIPPLLISYHFMRDDRHSRMNIEAAATRLLLIEADWKALSPGSYFSTYERVCQAQPAQLGDHSIFHMFWWLWLLLAGLSGGIHLIWHLFNGLGAMKMS